MTLTLGRTIPLVLGAVSVALLLALSGCGSSGSKGAAAATPSSDTLGGTVAGLGSNTGLVLANGSTTLTVPAGATSFSFGSLPSGTSYAITVQSAPDGLTCTVAGGSGTLSADVINVAVTCSAQSFTLGGTVAGLGSNTGLVLANGSTTLTVPAGATSFSFGSLPSGTSYAITVQGAPGGLTCTVAGGSGTLSADVANVVVTCSAQSFTLGGTIVFAAGSSDTNVTGLVLANGSDTLSVPSGATTFTLPTKVAYSSSYQVTVQTQPTGMSCAVSPSVPSTMPASNVTSVVVTCSDQPYALGGSVTLNGPMGVALSDQNLVLTNAANADTYTFSINATSFTMPMSVPYGSAYALSVTTQPAGLSCAVNNGTGTMPAGAVTLTVVCSDQSYALGGTVTITTPSGVTGLSDQGLVLTNTANSDTYTFSSNASSFTMPMSVPYGSAYTLSVTTQPAGLSCAVTDPSSTMPANAVNNVAVNCSDNIYAVGGAIHGLSSASGLVLTDNNADATDVLANASGFTMNTDVPYGAPYSVAVQDAPIGLKCTVAQGTGIVPASSVSNISVTCAAWQESVLDSLGSGSDGASPTGNLIQASDGNLYGMTSAGGANGLGAVIEYNMSTSSESVLYSFGSSGDGASPAGSLIQASDGNLYGMTLAGGANGLGAVIEYNMSNGGSESVLHSFGSSGDGASPAGDLIQASDGNLYGMTSAGGANNEGAVIEYNMSNGGSESVLYSFGSASSDGTYPYGSLIQASDGNLYGMTSAGGMNNEGAVIEYNVSNSSESAPYSFGSASGDGYDPTGSLIQARDGNLYGMTNNGGTNNEGAVIEYNVSNSSESAPYSFGSASGDGTYPNGSLILASDGNLYGMTTIGGTNNEGAVIEYDVSTVSESVLYSFGSASSDGTYPYDSLIQASDGNLYGLTSEGGTNNEGTVFTIN